MTVLSTHWDEARNRIHGENQDFRNICYCYIETRNPSGWTESTITTNLSKSVDNLKSFLTCQVFITRHFFRIPNFVFDVWIIRHQASLIQLIEFSYRQHANRCSKFFSLFCKPQRSIVERNVVSFIKTLELLYLGPRLWQPNSPKYTALRQVSHELCEETKGNS